LVIGLLLLALGIPLAVHLLLSILLAVLWRIRHRRRVWDFEFTGMSANGVRHVGSTKNSQREFISDRGGLLGPWSAIHHQTGLQFRSRLSLAGSPKIVVRAQSINDSSGVVGVSLGAKMRNLSGRFWGRLRGNERDDRIHADRAIIGQPVSYQWIIVGLRRERDMTLSGRLLVIGRPEDVVSSGEGSMPIADRVRDILQFEVCDRYQSLFDSLEHY
jgi:hypothetical protein